MSEYWKSTPKYWCKYCKTYVRDTGLERKNHEATAKHQGNLQRSLRELHKGHERDEREKQRAKDEVDRLNGVKKQPASNSSSSQRTAAPATPNTAARQANPAERKRQLQQLADLGVAVPEDFRREMAMAGDWQTAGEKVIYEGVGHNIKPEQGDDRKELKTNMAGIGVRKRKVDDEEEEHDSRAGERRKNWGSTKRAYPGGADGNDDLEALLTKTANGVKTSQEFRNAETGTVDESVGTAIKGEVNDEATSATVKGESTVDDKILDSTLPDPTLQSQVQVKPEPDLPGSNTASTAEGLFKKRKPKMSRAR